MKVEESNIFKDFVWNSLFLLLWFIDMFMVGIADCIHFFI